MKKITILLLLFTYLNINCEYIVQDKLKPIDLIDISDDQIEDHWKLYKGYVDNVNKLDEQLDQMRKDGKSKSLDYADRRRRYGFEYNGMVLHEYYFGNLTNNDNYKKIGETILQALNNSFGSYEAWLNDFVQAGKTRSIGWVILYMDPQTNKLLNVFVQDHENGNIAAFQPLLVMDVWEHAYMIDYSATQRPEYIDAFLKNINWFIVEKRFNQVKNGNLTKRYEKYSLKKKTKKT
jgi:Fe-Mn family superoxide dismutase